MWNPTTFPPAVPILKAENQAYVHLQRSQACPKASDRSLTHELLKMVEWQLLFRQQQMSKEKLQQQLLCEQPSTRTQHAQFSYLNTLGINELRNKVKQIETPH